MASTYAQGPDGAIYRWTPELERQEGFTFLHATPTVAAIAPSEVAIVPSHGPASGGTTVVITGSHFNLTKQVYFGATPAARFTIDSDTQITAISPAGTAGATGHITVLADENTSEGTDADIFTYNALPTVTGLTPALGVAAGGESIVIAGTGLTGATAVLFGTTPATSFVVDSDEQITAVAPAHAAGTVDVRVTTPNGQSANTAGDNYVYWPLPTVTSLTAAAGTAAGGDNVVIAGTGFTGATAVKFGTTDATSFVVDSATQITAVSPAHAAGAVDVAVTTPGGTNVNTAGNNFAFEAVAE